MNTIIYFEIQATKPAELVSFYTAVFGWDFKKVEGMDFDMYTLSDGNINGTLLQRPGATPEKSHLTNTFMSGIQVENLEETTKKITDHGGDIIMEKMEIPGVGFRGYFRDSDNNIFCAIEKL